MLTLLTDARRVAGQRVARMAFAPESPSRVDASVQTAAVVDSAFVHAALAFRLVFPLAAVVGAIANLVPADAHPAAAVKLRFRVASDGNCT